MAVTVTPVAGADGPFPFGPMFAALVDVAFDSSYPTGGEAINTVNTFGWAQIFMVIPQTAAVSDQTTGLIVKWNPTTSKLVAYFAPANAADAALDEVADTTNLSTFSVRALFLGR